MKQWYVLYVSLYSYMIALGFNNPWVQIKYLALCEGVLEGHTRDSIFTMSYDMSSICLV